jgi:branched-subunit amino acid transport protein
VIDLYALGAIAGITAATFIARSTLLLVGLSLRFPPAVEAALRFAPACALAAIIVPDLLFTDGVADLSWSNHRLLAGIAGAAIFAAFRSVIGTIGGGMAVFWLLGALT